MILKDKPLSGFGLWWRLVGYPAWQASQRHSA